jgi:hypothetical protein
MAAIACHVEGEGSVEVEAQDIPRRREHGILPAKLIIRYGLKNNQGVGRFMI